MNGSFLLRVNDVFSMPRGPLVTGRIERGVVTVGMRVTISGEQGTHSAIVRGIEQFRSILNEAHAGQDVALLLEGVERANLAAGHVISSAADPVVPPAA